MSYSNYIRSKYHNRLDEIEEYYLTVILKEQPDMTFEDYLSCVSEDEIKMILGL
jgi:helix-turn-helix protein